MKGKLRIVLTVILGAVFLVSSGLMLRQYLGDREVEGTYQEALELALAAPAAELAAAPTMAAVTEPLWAPAPVEEADPHMEELSRLDLAALRQVNPDVIGWIRIPDTKIDYPFLQGEDNEYYLTHTWEGEKNAAGSIFLECMNSGDLTDFNTILYGHNMNSGAMFAGLRKYTSQNFFEAHPYVYLLEDETAHGITEKLKEVMEHSDETLFHKGTEARCFVLEQKNNVIQARKILEMLNG